jgi:hypothetical protein
LHTNEKEANLAYKPKDIKSKTMRIKLQPREQVMERIAENAKRIILPDEVKIGAKPENVSWSAINEGLNENSKIHPHEIKSSMMKRGLAGLVYDMENSNERGNVKKDIIARHNVFNSNNANRHDFLRKNQVLYEDEKTEYLNMGLKQKNILTDKSKVAFQRQAKINNANAIINDEIFAPMQINEKSNAKIHAKNEYFTTDMRPFYKTIQDVGKDISEEFLTADVKVR